MVAERDFKLMTLYENVLKESKEIRDFDESKKLKSFRSCIQSQIYKKTFTIYL